MPTILQISGWRFFFYANEGNEPIHVHCRRAEAEAKLWLDVDSFNLIEAHSYNLSPGEMRMVRKIIFQHFDYIVGEWDKFQEKKDG